MKNTTRSHTSFLTIAFLLALSSAAHAQHWVVTSVYSGTIKDPAGKTTNWAANGSNINQKWTVGSDGSSTGGSFTGSSSGTVTLTYTWNDDGTGQPAPKSIYVTETGSASCTAKVITGYNIPTQYATPVFSGNATLGIGNVVSTPTGPQNTAYSFTQTSAPSKQTWEKMSGPVFTKTISFGGNASVSWNKNPAVAELSVGMSAGLTLHATPYGFHHTNSVVA